MEETLDQHVAVHRKIRGALFLKNFQKNPLLYGEAQRAYDSMVSFVITARRCCEHGDRHIKKKACALYETALREKRDWDETMRYLGLRATTPSHHIPNSSTNFEPRKKKK